jgi:hypothetical protein
MRQGLPNQALPANPVKNTGRKKRETAGQASSVCPED